MLFLFFYLFWIEFIWIFSWKISLKCIDTYFFYLFLDHLILNILHTTCVCVFESHYWFNSIELTRSIQHSTANTCAHLNTKSNCRYIASNIFHLHTIPLQWSRNLFIASAVAYTFKLDFLQPHESEKNMRQSDMECLVWEQKWHPNVI